MTVIVMLLFLTVPCVGLQCVIVVFPDHTRLLFFPAHKCYNANILIFISMCIQHPRD